MGLIAIAASMARSIGQSRSAVASASTTASYSTPIASQTAIAAARPRARSCTRTVITKASAVKTATSNALTQISIARIGAVEASSARVSRNGRAIPPTVAPMSGSVSPRYSPANNARRGIGCTSNSSVNSRAPYRDAVPRINAISGTRSSTTLSSDTSADGPLPASCSSRNPAMASAAAYAITQRFRITSRD